MNYVGISCGYHDAALSVIDDAGEILFAGHSERYSKIKSDNSINSELIHNAFHYLNSEKISLHYYESPFLKTLRNLYSGKPIVTSKLFMSDIIGKSNHSLLHKLHVKKYYHHLSHAASGFQTSVYDDAIVLIIDAIGEFDTASIYYAYYEKGFAKYKKLWSMKYPNSIGLFYSAMTKRLGLKPLDEEYILMGMSAYGKDILSDKIKSDFIDIKDDIYFKNNLHLGIDDNYLINESDYDIACSTQKVLEFLLCNLLKRSKYYADQYNTNSIVYGGGVALNCLANRLIGYYFKNIWIMPNPGDAGSSLGAAALGYGKKVHWKTPCLGYDIEKIINIDDVVTELLTSGICGIANGRSEFGPRAFGNRSLLADPRILNIKTIVNSIKRRQNFRPFAPIILEEYLHDYFELPPNWDTSRYMQVVSKCKFPELTPGIVHVDNTSRVQSVPNDNSVIRKILEQWYQKTNCPILLNTSLNIKNQPMVNDLSDAIKFQKIYEITVF
jgi:carbamoyltransferase